MSIGKRLSELIDALKLQNKIKTKKEFCELIGIDEKNLNKYINEVMKPYGVIMKNHEKLTEMGIDIGWILTGQKEMFIKEELPINQSIGRRLQEFRVSINMTKESISKIINMREIDISEIEKGERRISLELLLNYYKCFHVDLGYIITGEKQEEITPDIKELVELLRNYGTSKIIKEFTEKLEKLKSAHS